MGRGVRCRSYLTHGTSHQKKDFNKQLYNLLNQTEKKVENLKKYKLQKEPNGNYITENIIIKMKHLSK